MSEKAILDLVEATLQGKIEGFEDGLADMGGDFPQTRIKVEYATKQLKEILDLIQRLK